MDFIFNHTEKVIDIITVELDYFNFFCIHYGRKFGRNCSSLGSNCHVLLNLPKLMFGYKNPNIFFQYTFLFSRTHQYANTNSSLPLSML